MFISRSFFAYNNVNFVINSFFFYSVIILFRFVLLDRTRLYNIVTLNIISDIIFVSYTGRNFSFAITLLIFDSIIDSKNNINY